MSNEHLIIEQSLGLSGEASLVGAKNAVLVIIASLVLTRGKSVLKNVPASDDVQQMIKLLQSIGAEVAFFESEHRLEVDTASITKWVVPAEIMKKMRASILVMGPLLARFGRAHVAVPGGCTLGARSIDYHLINLAKMGVTFEKHEELLVAQASGLKAQKLVLEYPSVGATENLMMAAALTKGVTRIVNAALEPEVLDLVKVLQKMGARITILPPATIEIEGVDELHPIEHEVMYDRLEAGALLLAAAITGGEISLPQAPAYAMDIFLMKLQEMGHSIEVGAHDQSAGKT